MTTAATQQVVTFRLGDDLFAADIYAVERVLRYAKPMAVPNVPDWVDGLIEYQQHVVPVVDLRARFSLERTPARPETRILIFAVAEQLIGIRVDAVLEVATLPADRLSPPPAFFRGLAGDYLQGIVRTDTRLIILLDVPRLLTAAERMTLLQATEDALADA